MSRSIVVLVTCGSAREAKRIATALVLARLVACVNVLDSRVRSIYRWKGRVEIAKEHLLLIKTSGSRFGAVEKEIRRLHSYDVPEIVALPIIYGSMAYLEWLKTSVTKAGGGRRRK